ncbi:hypothetical protein BUE93_19520 [Chromobacterium amazonense]|uniref:Amidohydrolase-related domain-containing protein n=1 Tax=Chromobacterium amazonense TaxID=1382803 RepID=A0A2S9WZP0_9NEIS|nr:DUF6282 family protein [Chromobacterium amazonense]PRP68935.1 hypothetical protein BUE93_19520 [Chromobacterium amazonense]
MSAFQSYWRERLRFLDVHYHAAPDAFRRRHGVIETGRRYQALQGGVVLKNHLGDSVASAEAARALDLPVFGSTVLNAVAGGPCRRALEASLCRLQSEHSGRLLVHLPTVTGTSHRSRLSRSHSNPFCEAAFGEAAAICDEQGQLLPQTRELLAMARDYPLVISSGHASRNEVMRLLDAADQLGTPRLMLNQPANPMTGMSAADLAAIAGPDWLYIEQTALTYLLGYQDWDDFQTVLRELPNVVYSSDLGQTSQPDIEDWHRQSLGWFDDMRLDSKRRDSVWLETPLAMLTP